MPRPSRFDGHRSIDSISSDLVILRFPTDRPPHLPSPPISTSHLPPSPTSHPPGLPPSTLPPPPPHPRWEVGDGRATVTGKFDSIDSIVDPIRCVGWLGMYEPTELRRDAKGFCRRCRREFGFTRGGTAVQNSRLGEHESGPGMTGVHSLICTVAMQSFEKRPPALNAQCWRLSLLLHLLRRRPFSLMRDHQRFCDDVCYSATLGSYNRAPHNGGFPKMRSALRRKKQNNPYYWETPSGPKPYTLPS